MLNDSFDRDPYLIPFRNDILNRHRQYLSVKADIEREEGMTIAEFAKGYMLFGLNYVDGQIVIREYIPLAVSVFLCGDFNYWDRSSHPLSPEGFGKWSISLNHNVIHPGQKYKLSITTSTGEKIDRVPAWATQVLQNPDSNLFDAVVPNPPDESIRPNRPSLQGNLRIYEAHVGMSSEEGRVATYDDFRLQVLPRIVDLGYTALQLMAVMEHSYYGSFGYHATSFFACASRSGSPESLKLLIDAAHAAGLIVLMDVVHSHCSDNACDGIAYLDGTLGSTYTRSEIHPLWDSAMFDYSRWETIRFLLSNLRYWLEFGFDGFRFDGVTSMLYTHHGAGVAFSGDYSEYFGSQCDTSASVYMMLANEVIHSVLPSAVTIAEDVSGMPLLCRPMQEGGLGFDYRLAMAVPDLWIKYLKEVPDESWNMGHLVFSLTNRRWMEPCVAYCESHDQSIVGDKTILMWLMGSAIYTDMSVLTESIIADRGIALHKMIRLLTFALGGEAYLNFMGNEFGHPEWVDFPRDGNDWSFQWCRRQWSLADTEHLRYQALLRFDQAMQSLDATHNVLKGRNQWVLETHEDDKLIVFQKSGLLFLFNFHPSHSLVDRVITTGLEGELCLALDSDAECFGGHSHIEPHSLLAHSGKIKVYIPARTALVYGKR